MTAGKIKRKGDNILRDALILCLITLVLGSVLGITYIMTKSPIDNGAIAAKNEAFIRTFPGQEVTPVENETLNGQIKNKGTTGKGDDMVIISDGAVINDKTGAKAGYSFIAAAKGYNGNVTVSVGIDNNGAVTGIDIVSMNETAGLGANCTEESFKEQFTGKSGKIVTGRDIDAISGATITTDAVVSAVNACLKFASGL